MNHSCLPSGPRSLLCCGPRAGGQAGFLEEVLLSHSSQPSSTLSFCSDAVLEPFFASLSLSVLS